MAIVTKTYIEKSNTIYEKNCVNVGFNPVSEISFGKEKSRTIMYFNHEKVKKMVEDKTYYDINKLKHVLKITNTASFDDDIIFRHCGNIINEENKKRANSFDLVFFTIPQEWDRGLGYSYKKDFFKKRYNEENLSIEGSNWYNSRNKIKWYEEGIYSTDTISKEIDKFLENKESIVFGYQHFELGNENIELDITKLFNDFILNKKNNNGFCIAFSPMFEYDKDKEINSVFFFNNNTNSFFEPYVETTYEDYIKDDRSNFYLDKNNRLYFYASVASKKVNLDKIPRCTINNVEYEVKYQEKGVYYVDVMLTSDLYEKDTMLYDVWDNIFYNGRDFGTVELYFTTKDNGEYYSFGLPNNNEYEGRVIPHVYGINENEDLKPCEIKKINIDCKIEYTNIQKHSIEGLEYRLYVKDLTKEYDVISWKPVEIGYNENYFLINTNELKPSTYYVDIRVNDGSEISVYKEKLIFNIISEKQ